MTRKETSAPPSPVAIQDAASPNRGNPASNRPAAELVATLQASNRAFAAEFFAALSPAELESVVAYVSHAGDAEPADVRVWLVRSFGPV